MPGSFRKNFKKSLSGVVARLWRKPDMSLADVVAAGPRRILIVRQHNQMGDMVCATPAFRAIRETFPQAEIALVCAPVNRDVVRHNPDIDRHLTFDKTACRRPAPLLAFIRTIRDFRPQLAFVLNSVSFSVTSAALAAVSGADMIIGNDSRPFGFDISRHAYSLVMPSNPRQTEHAVLHNLNPLRAVGIDTRNEATVVRASADELGQAAEIAARIPGDGRLWILHPGAGKTDNLWPTDRFADIAGRVLQAGHRLLVLQGPADADVMAAFRKHVDHGLDDGDSRRMLIIPPVTVGVCAALLATADRFLCNDTGLMHVAGAVSVPTLALFGPTNPELWKPRTPGCVHLQAESGRLADIDADAVWHNWSTLESGIIREG